MEKLVNINPEIMGGTPVFMGTRVPVSFLPEYLAEGGTLTEFLADYPTVSREQALAFLDAAAPAVIAKQHGAAAA